MQSRQEFDDQIPYALIDERLFQLFQRAVEEPILAKHILVVQGVGGIGKSMHLGVFRRYCLKSKFPVAFVSGDDAKSSIDLLSTLSDDFKNQGLKLSRFSKTLEQFRTIQAVVDEKASKIAGEVASKRGEAAADALAGAAIGSLILGVGGDKGVALGDLGAKALIDWLGSFLGKSDVEVILEPAKKLTDAFVRDVVQVAVQRRVVLMLDSFEQLTALGDWVSHLVRRLRSNVLWVIAGREFPDWNRTWPDWFADARIEVIEPLSDANMRAMVLAYYARISGGDIDSATLESVVKFARGLPLAATLAIQLWTKYGIKDIESIQPELVSDLVERLLESVPQDMLFPLEAASILPWFTKESLIAITGLRDEGQIFDNLRKYPFVMPRAEGYQVQDTVRQWIRDYVRLTLNPERYQLLLENATSYLRATSLRLREYKTAGFSGILEIPEKTFEKDLGDATYELGLLYSEQGRWADALELLTESLKLRRNADNLNLRADAIYQVARINHLLGNLDKARIHYRDALRLYHETENNQGIAACYANIGRLMIQLGYIDDALRELEAAKKIYGQLRDNRRIAEVNEVLNAANQIKGRLIA